MHRALLFWGEYVWVPCTSHETQTRALIQLQGRPIYKALLFNRRTNSFRIRFQSLQILFPSDCDHCISCYIIILSIQSTDSFGLHTRRLSCECVKSVFWESACSYVFRKTARWNCPGTCTCWKFQINSSTYSCFTPVRSVWNYIRSSHRSTFLSGHIKYMLGRYNIIQSEQWLVRCVLFLFPHTLFCAPLM